MPAIRSLLFVLVLISCYINFVASKTCVCADFLKDDCEEEGCVWEDYDCPNEPCVGTRGHCRSTKYDACKKDPKCTIKEQDPRLKDDNPSADVPDAADAELAGVLDANDYVPPDQDQTNGKTPSEDDNKDYPYECKSEPRVYADFMIDVTEIELAAQNIFEKQQAMMVEVVAAADDAEHIDSVQHANTNIGAHYQSFGSLQLVAGLIFVVILIPSVIYWKCKGHSVKGSGIGGISESDYSTFNL